ncbi:glycosyltransferase [Chitinophagaceae bacterium MMS25-I14]
MQSGKHQVFQTQSPTRWQRFKWTFRVIAFILLLLVLVLTIAMFRVYNPSIPQLKELGEQYKSILQPDKHALIQQNKINKEYEGFRKYIKAKGLRNKPLRYVNKADSVHAIEAPIRAAFYVAWDAQSFFSLRNNISRMNMILPEWFFIDPKGDTLSANMDQRGLSVIKASGIRVVPVLSNFYHDNFNGDAIHRIVTTPAKRERLISDVINILKKNKFAGINVDFEELKEETDENIISFMKELYERLHAENLLVTQDVSPFNDDYNYEELVKYNDYIFLMAYDEHNNGTTAGPVSSQKWVEAAVNEATKRIPPEKLVLCLACFGYDWPLNSEGKDLTYEEALTVASESEGKVDFDDDTYNLHYSYFDDNNVAHNVHFTDAATNFNTMRFAAEYGLGGVSIWRLGAEDSRLWWFYNKDMSHDAVSKFDFTIMDKVKASNDVDYIGEGEILDVLSTPKDGQISVEIDSSEKLISEEHYESLPSMFVVKKYGNAKKKIVLSFDDGPDPKYTPRILDILKRENVPGVFFLIGINAENNIPLVKRIFRAGYEIGSHTFTHPNMAEVSKSRATLELNATRLLIECITGHSTVMFRAPFNADSEPETMQEIIPVALAKQYKYLTVGESIDPCDWEENINADTIFNRIVAQEGEGNIILLHDSGGDRESTVEVLPRIIKYFKQKGYQFTTVADLVGKTKEELMPKVPESSGYYIIQLNYYVAAFGYWGGRVLFVLFLTCIILSMLRVLMLAILAWLQYRKDKKEQLPLLKDAPLVSIIVPAYNEEVNAVASLQNLLRTTYPNFNIIFVDDGSKDATYERVQAAFANDPRVTVLTKPNGGKASALNYGIAQSTAAFVMCIDADTQLLPDALPQMMRHFVNEEVGAVAGNVKVGNQVNLLTKWQSIEYITSQNFDRQAFAYINAITVVPGAIGVFRKEAIEIAGGFTSDTFAEDCDLTIRILRAGYIISNENKAIALTEAPETRKMFLKQRFRWTFGVMQAFWKNRDALFNREYKWLGWAALPNILVFQILIPLLAPLAEVFLVIGLLTGNGLQILEYYAVFMLVDAVVAIAAFMFEKENAGKLIWLIPQRLVYRWFMLYVLFKAIRKAIKGELQSWGVLKRTGNVQTAAE